MVRVALSLPAALVVALAVAGCSGEKAVAPARTSAEQAPATRPGDVTTATSAPSPTATASPTPTPEPTPTALPVPTGYAVDAQTAAPGYRIAMQREGDFVVLMKRWGVMDGTYTGGYGILGTTGYSPVKAITIVFSTEQQMVNWYGTTDGEIYLSSITHAAPGRLTVTAHIGPLILEDPAKADDLGQYLDTIVLVTLYNLSHHEEWSKGLTNDPDGELMRYFRQKHEQGLRFFDLVKE